MKRPGGRPPWPDLFFVWLPARATGYDRYGKFLATDVKGANMNAVKIAAIVLIVAGALRLAYGELG